MDLQSSFFTIRERRVLYPYPRVHVPRNSRLLHPVSAMNELNCYQGHKNPAEPEKEQICR